MSTLAHSHLPRCRLPCHLLLLRVLLLPQIVLLLCPRLHPLRGTLEDSSHASKGISVPFPVSGSSRNPFAYVTPLPSLESCTASSELQAEPIGMKS
ncbi:hypothetical protein Tco_0548821 [Tanacetum coccineum]